MALRDVKEIVAAYQGMPNGTPLDARAARLTIGDRRLLVNCASAMIEESREPRVWMNMLGSAGAESAQGVMRVD